MKALVLHGPNEYAIEEVQIPEPGRPEVVCRIHAVAICGSDPGFISGKTAGTWPPGYPFTIGHEWAGVVEKVGTDVTSWRPGDQVVGEAHNGCGQCRNCKEGRYNLCLNYGNPQTEHRHYGHRDSGAFAEYGAFNQRSLTPLPAGVSFEVGSVVDAAGTALHVAELTGITPGGTVAVIGPGPIGLITAKVVKALGAARVIMIGRGARLESSLAIVADDGVNFEKEDVPGTVMELTEGMGVDQVFECSGGAGTLQQAIEICRRGGQIGIVGIPAPGSRESIDSRSLIIREISIHGSRANPNVTRKLLSMLQRGALDFSDIITHTFALVDFHEAMQTFLDRTTGALKVVVKP